MSSSTSVYKEVVAVTEYYFGPAADRFIIRQIQNHLNKDPEELQRRELVELIKWITLSMALLVEDEKLIKKFTSDLEKLSTTHTAGRMITHA